MEESMRLFEEKVRKGNQLIEAQERAIKPRAEQDANVELVGDLLKPKLAVPANRIINSLIAVANKTQSREVEIDLKEIERITRNDSMTAREYKSCVLAIGRVAYSIDLPDEDAYIVIPLFDRITYHTGSKKIQARISESAAYYINIDTPFTQYYLSDYLSLSSKYSQALFERLKKWEKKGRWETQLPELRKLLLFPVGYLKNMGQLKRKVLEPVRKELREKTNFIFSYTINKIKASNNETFINVIFTIGKQEEKPKEIKPKQAAYLCARNLVNKNIECKIYHDAKYEYKDYQEEQKCTQCRICKYIEVLRQKKLAKQAEQIKKDGLFD